MSSTNSSSSTDYVKPNRRRLFRALLASAVTAAALAKATVPSKAGCYSSGNKTKVRRKHHGY
jgi:hypothetical protein